MTTTIAALRLFIQSLPENCKFAILLFGDNDDQVYLTDRTGMKYNNINM